MERQGGLFSLGKFEDTVGQADIQVQAGDGHQSRDSGFGVAFGEEISKPGKSCGDIEARVGGDLWHISGYR